LCTDYTCLINNALEPEMTKSQERAIAYFRRFMEGQLNKTEAYGDTLVTFEVTATSYGTFWILAKTDMVKLGENNVLRFVEAQHWFVHVGKRGALEVKSAPKSFKQFNGKGRAFNMTFDC
jgi:hypothetical protein